MNDMDQYKKIPPPKILWSTTLHEDPPHNSVRASVLQDSRTNNGEIYASIKLFIDGMPSNRGISIKGSLEIDIVKRLIWELERAMGKQQNDAPPR